MPFSVIVCAACGTSSSAGTAICPVCTSSLTPAALACARCKEVAFPGQKFCSMCGWLLGAKSDYRLYHPVLAQSQLRIIVLNQPTIAYGLIGEELILGKKNSPINLDDPFISPSHARIFYQKGQIFIQDTGSTNGTFVNVRGTTPINSGSFFIVGNQLLQANTGDKDPPPLPDNQGTIFYSTARYATKINVSQRLLGGGQGLVYRCRNEQLTIGRLGNDINFPEDIFLSEKHAQLSLLPNQQLQLTDLGSANGTFLQIDEPYELMHGDYFILGQTLFRVEI